MQRNFNIDFLKIILSIFVIAAHVFPTSEIEGSKNLIFYLIQGLARLTVPLFFIITGYFVENKIYEEKYLKKTLLKILRIFIIWQIIYIPIEYKYYDLKVISLQRFCLDLFYGIAHLWYLNGLIVGLILLYFLKNKSNKTKLLISFTLFCFAFLFQFLFENKLIKTNSNWELIYQFIGTTRNGIFYALPYLILGNLYTYLKNILIFKKILLTILIICLFIESYINMFNLSIFNIFIVSYPLSLLIFDLILNSKNKITFHIPESLSLGIYLIHFFILNKIFQKNPPVTILDCYLNFLIVTVLTFIVWFLLDKFNRRINLFF